jgi:hypothetical protein
MPDGRHPGALGHRLGERGQHPRVVGHVRERGAPHDLLERDLAGAHAPLELTPGAPRGVTAEELGQRPERPRSPGAQQLSVRGERPATVAVDIHQLESAGRPQQPAERVAVATRCGGQLREVAPAVVQQVRHTQRGERPQHLCGEEAPQQVRDPGTVRPGHDGTVGR